jgi:hypothetical protein
MSAIAPPPVGAEAEPSVVFDNACALAALRESLLKPRRQTALGRFRVRRLAPPPSLAVLLAFGAAKAIVALGSKDPRRPPRARA